MKTDNLTYQERKRRLIEQIQQQRLEFTEYKQACLVTLQPIDRTWNFINHYKLPLIAGAIIIVVTQLRHPAKLLTLSRKAVRLLGTVQFLQSSLYPIFIASQTRDKSHHN